jgi:predicted nucleic-acid-binding protein
LIGVDTNILVRFVVADDPVQAEEATRFLEQRCSPERPAFVNRVVVAETVWVLERAYRYRREQVVDVLTGLLATSSIVVEDAADVARAVELYRQGAGFTDALVGVSNARQGCASTATFDRKAKRFASIFGAP